MCTWTLYTVANAIDVWVKYVSGEREWRHGVIVCALRVINMKACQGGGMCTFPIYTISDRMSRISATNLVRSPWLTKGLSAIIEYPTVYRIRRCSTLRCLWSGLCLLCFFHTLSFLVWSLLPTDGTCRWLFLLWITLGRITLDEWSARCSDLYQTTHNIHNRQTSVSLVLFEPAIPVCERPQTHALNRAAILNPLALELDI